MAGSTPPDWLSDGLHKIDAGLSAFTSDCKNESGLAAAHKLAPIYGEMLDLYARVKASDLNAEAKADLELELSLKIDDFQAAFRDLLGLDLIAFTTSGGGQGPGGRGASADVTARSVWPGEDFSVRAHVADATGAASA